MLQSDLTRHSVSDLRLRAHRIAKSHNLAYIGLASYAGRSAWEIWVLRILVSVGVLVGISGAASAAGDAGRLNTAELPEVARVDRRFQSYNVEMAEIVGGRFWAPYAERSASPDKGSQQADGSLGFDATLFRQRPPADLTDRRLRNMARALGPVYIRVSGSWANKVFFQDDDLAPMARPPKGFDNVLTRQQWAGVLDFARAVDGQITTSFAVSDGARDADGVWSPDEARKLLRYTRALGGTIHSAELINEPNLGEISGLPAGYDAKRYARDIAAFQSFVHSEAPDLKTVGPGSTGETGVALFNNRGLSTDAMLSAEPRARFDYFSYHFYGGRSQRCAQMAPASAILPEDALSEEWLGRTDKALSFYKDLRDRFMPGAPIWLNETAQASCGGDKWAASFLDTFRYVDQMGRLAKQGVSVIMHNTLAASDYALIDEATMTPRPSYWAAVLWRRLMGEVVLDAGPMKPGFHVYAHCLRGRSGGVALAVINLDRSRPASLELSSSGRRYTLSADDLQSGSVRLNGRPLNMAGDRLPAMRGRRTSGRNVSIAPATITFLAMPGAANAACAERSG
jgi:heparanase